MIRPSAAAMRALVPTIALLIGTASAAETKPAPLREPTPAPAVEGEGSITVTVTTVAATKLDIPAQEVPQTLTVISADLMRSTGSYTLRDALRNVPGVTLLAGEHGVRGDRMFIRGFSANTDIFIDGQREAGQYYRDGFNIGQIEVLKGPSGMLFGRGTTGGAINLVTKRPTDEWSGDAGYTIGSYDFTRIQGGVGGPLVDDKLGMRFDAFTQQADSHRDEQHSKSWGVAPTVGVRLAPETDVFLQYLHQEQDGTIDYGIPMYNGEPIDMPVGTYYGFRDDSMQRIEVDTFGVTLEHRLSDQWTLRNATRYGESYRTHRSERINSINNVTNVGTRNQTLFGSDWTSLANQTELTYKGDLANRPLSVVTGIEGASETYEDRTRASTSADPSVWEIDLFNPISAPTVGAGRADSLSDPTGHTRSELKTLAAYAFGVYDVADEWTLSLGLRLEYFTADVHNYISNADFDSAALMFSPRGGVIWKPLEEWAFYASLGMSHNPAAENYALNTNTDEPEETISFEIGAKGELLDGALGLSVALFRVDKYKARTPSTVPGEPNVLDGKVENTGIEFGANGKITDAWTVFGGIVLMDPEIVESNTASLVGNQMQNTPETSGNLWTTYEVGYGFTAGLGFIYVGERFANDANTVEVPSYIRVDLSLAYNAPSWYAQFNLFNLTDEVYYAEAHSVFAIPGAPLSGQFTVGATF